MSWLCKRLFGMAALLLIAGLGLNWLGERAGAIYKDGAAQVCEGKRRAVRAGLFAPQPGSRTVLFFGTSRILAGIIPARFDKLTGQRTRSANLALPGLPISASYYILLDYLRRYPAPEFVVLQLHTNRCRSCAMSNYYMAQGMSAWRELPTLLARLRQRGVLLNVLFPFRMYKYMVVEYLHESLARPRRIARLQANNRQTTESMIAARGYYFINTPQAGAAAADMEELAERMEFDPFDDPFCELFFSLTRRLGTRVLLVESPQRAGHYQPYDTMPRQYALLLSRYDHVRMARDGWRIKTQPANQFFDRLHLTPRGAMVFTRRVVDEFLECFCLPPEVPAP